MDVPSPEAWSTCSSVAAVLAGGIVVVASGTHATLTAVGAKFVVITRIAEVIRVLDLGVVVVVMMAMLVQ